MSEAGWQRAHAHGTEQLGLGEIVERLAGATGQGVRVAVLDSGIERGHPDVAQLSDWGNFVVGPSGRVESESAPEVGDRYGHGTAVASVLAWLSPGVALRSYQVLDGSSQGQSPMIAASARHAIEAGSQILHCSFGSALQQRLWDYKSWVDLAAVRGAIIVAAGGRRGPEREEYPAYFASVLSVAARGREAGASFRGCPRSLIDLSAPGEDVVCAWKGGTRQKMAGSSFASPMVTALVARALECWPGLSTWEVKALLVRIAEAEVPMAAWAGGGERALLPDY